MLARLRLRQYEYRTSLPLLFFLDASTTLQVDDCAQPCNVSAGQPVLGFLARDGERALFLDVRQYDFRFGDPRVVLQPLVAAQAVRVFPLHEDGMEGVWRVFNSYLLEKKKGGMALSQRPLT